MADGVFRCKASVGLSQGKALRFCRTNVVHIMPFIIPSKKL